MPYHRRLSAKMADFDDEVTVVDVYDLASDIGKECEIIIEKYGADAVTSLLPKVINALELLENLAVRNEKENQALQELTAKISQLENDKVEKAEYRQRFEKEIEAIEEQWRTESAELVTAVARLQDENKRLRRTINAPGDGTSAPPSPAREHDQEVLSRLSSTAEKQRATLRHQEVQLQEKQQLIDSLTSQVEKLATVSRDLRRKQKQLQNQIRLVCEERTELNTIVQSQQREIAALQADTTGKDKCPSCAAAAVDGSEGERPLFSAREMRSILHERNELKQRLERLEEQVAAIQPQQPDSGSSSSSSASGGGCADEDEAPVQGPLPAEPDDAPWKRQSGIRKFYLGVGGTRRRRGPRVSALGTKRHLWTKSLTSPWDRSPAVRSPRWHPRWPPARLEPPPPPRARPPPIPQHLRTRRAPTRRRSDPEAPLDLRRELQDELDLRDSNIEIACWLGNKYYSRDIVEYDFESKIDDDEGDDDDYVPLQRSLSLDRGLQVFKCLQTLGSQLSVRGCGSAWTVYSDGMVAVNRLTDDRFSSFENLPMLPTIVLNVDGSYQDLTSLYGSGDAIDGSTADLFPDETTNPGRPHTPVTEARRGGSPVLLNRMLVRSMSSDPRKENANNLGLDMLRNQYMNVMKSQELSQQQSDNRDHRRPLYRNLSYRDINTRNLRKEVLLKKSLSVFKSLESLAPLPKATRRKPPDLPTLSLLKDSYKGIDFDSGSLSPKVIKLRKNFSFRDMTDFKERLGLENTISKAPSITVRDRSIFPATSLSSNTNSSISSVSLAYLDCDCGICSRSSSDERKSFLVRDFIRGLIYRVVKNKLLSRVKHDENNNWPIMEILFKLLQILKLLLGIWLRVRMHQIDA